MRAHAEALLRTMFGPMAGFRPDQWEVIEAVVRQRSRVLVVQRTGWGKSLVYFIATKLLRDQGAGPTVLIYQRPGSVVSYYQQIGRAGRAVEDASVILLNGREDDEIQDYFIQSAFSGAGEMQQILTVIEQSNGLAVNEILRGINLSRPRVERALKLLEVDGAITHSQTRYRRTVNPWMPDLERARRVTAQRRRELTRMQNFVSHTTCLMEFLTRELDDPEAKPCGRCANCAGDIVSRRADLRLVQDAITFLRRDSQVIEPRKQWPPGGVGGRSGRIPADRQNMEGRALCIYGDAGWGHAVAAGKYQARRFAGDPFHPKNLSSYHFASELILCTLNVFQVQGKCPAGPVLLVDDVVDSRWTLSSCGCLLREAGTGPVHPFALAVASIGEHII